MENDDCREVKKSSRPTKLYKVRPELEKFYSSENERKFEDLYIKSSIKVNWICEKDSSHVFSSRISHRAEDKAACPVCKNSYNMLVNDFPHIAAEYSPKNEIPLSEIKSASSRKILWECASGHEWTATPYSRICAKNSICKECELENITSFDVQYPDIAKHFSDENPLSIKDKNFRFHVHYLWMCEKSHKRKATAFEVLKRSANEYICAECEKEKNSLLSKRPDLEKFFSKNNSENFKDLASQSTKKVLWECPKGHEFLLTVAAMSYRKSGFYCNECEEDKNLFSRKFPELESEYSNKNTDNFKSFSLHSHKKRIWICKNGHEWKTRPINRIDIKTSKVKPCQYCIRDENLLSVKHPEMRKKYCPSNEVPFEELTVGMHKKLIWICEKGHKRRQSVYNTVRYPNCPQCMQWGTSILEQEVIAYVKSILPKDVEIKENDRKLISPKELDIYIPELSVAVEFNGLYWHSEANGKSKNYHYNKWKQCKSKNVQLITVWEDDWLYRQEHVKSQLSTLLRTPDKNLPTIHASKLSTKEVDKNKAKEFYNSSYLKEFSSDSNYYALVDNEKDSMCALLTWKQVDEKVVIIEDYCEKDSVVNGLEKLIHHILKRINNKNVENVIAHIDNSSVYRASFEKIGFMQVQSVKHIFSYVVKRERVHESHMSAAFFKDNQELVYDSDLTLEELKIKNGITKLWDCGKISYVLNL